MSNFIRQPDKPFHDCLLPRNTLIPYNDRFTEEEELRRVLTQSEMEYEYQMALFESKLEEGRRKAKEEREKHFASLKTKLIQFAKIDNANKELYQTLIQHITDYETGFTIRVEVSTEFYDHLLRIISNIRISNDEKKRILSFIVLTSTSKD